MIVHFWLQDDRKAFRLEFERAHLHFLCFYSTEEKYICSEDYYPANPDEIALTKGTIVEVVEKNLDGWWWIRYAPSSLDMNLRKPT